MDMFRAGQVAMIGQTSDSEGLTFDRDFPRWKASGHSPSRRARSIASYSGAGYWGVLHGTQPDECVSYIEFLSRDENMQEITEYIGCASPNKR